LRRAATFLRKVSIEIGFGREGHARTRTIHITAVAGLSGPEQVGVPPSAPSASSAMSLNVNSANGFADESLRTVVDDADGSARAVVSTVRANPLKNHDETAADRADANIAPRFGLGECKGSGWRRRL
jgi:hypothetical protein